RANRILWHNIHGEERVCLIAKTAVVNLARENMAASRNAVVKPEPYVAAHGLRGRHVHHPGLVRRKPPACQSYSHFSSATRKIVDHECSLEFAARLGLVDKGQDTNAVRVPIVTVVAGGRQGIGGAGAFLAP